VLQTPSLSLIALMCSSGGGAEPRRPAEESGSSQGSEQTSVDSMLMAIAGPGQAAGTMISYTFSGTALRLPAASVKHLGPVDKGR